MLVFEVEITYSDDKIVDDTEIIWVVARDMIEAIVMSMDLVNKLKENLTTKSMHSVASTLRITNIEELGADVIGHISLEKDNDPCEQVCSTVATRIKEDVNKYK